MNQLKHQIKEEESTRARIQLKIKENQEISTKMDQI